MPADLVDLNDKLKTSVVPDSVSAIRADIDKKHMYIIADGCSLTLDYACHGDAAVDFLTKDRARIEATRG